MRPNWFYYFPEFPTAFVCGVCAMTHTWHIHTQLDLSNLVSDSQFTAAVLKQAYEMNQNSQMWVLNVLFIKNHKENDMH